MDLNSDSVALGQSTDTQQQGEDDVVAAIYVRTSSSSQRFGYSIDEQLDRCWCECEASGWTVRYVFVDEAESAKNTDRPQFQKMLKKAEANAFDVVVVWKLDRFCRSLVDLVKTEETLAEEGIGLQSVTERLDTTSAVGRFNFRNLASAAELEREITSQRVKMGLHGLAKEHKWPNPFPPLGYVKTPEARLQIDSEEAELVREIYEMYLKKRSMPAVAHILNEEGHTTKKDNEWCRQSVQKVLSNELYIGNYSVAGYEKHVSEYRILSKDVFRKVKQCRHRFRHTKSAISVDRKEAIADRVLSAYTSRLEE